MSLGVWVFVALVVLGGAIAYGMIQYNRRNKAADPRRDAATRATYEENGPPGGAGG